MSARPEPVEPAVDPADRPVGARRHATKVVAGWADRLRPPPRGVVVLIYHRVGRTSTMEVDLPRALFADQMAWLAESGRVVTLDEALDRLVRPEPSSGPGESDPIVITFDDGTRDLAEVAAPILADHDLPALLYVATDFVERGRPFPDDGPALSWAELIDLAGAGWQVGSHTHTHALLDRLAPDQVADELDRSIDLIGEHLGRPPAHFAYPKAVLGHPEAQRAVRARFRSAAVAGTRPNRYGDTDPWCLARTPVQVSDGMRWFEAKAGGGLGLEDDLRAAANRVRYRGRTD